MTRVPRPEWVRWSIEIGEARDIRDSIKGHPHSMGEAWERGNIDYWQRIIDHLAAHEPQKYEDD